MRQFPYHFRAQFSGYGTILQGTDMVNSQVCFYLIEHLHAGCYCWQKGNWSRKHQYILPKFNYASKKRIIQGLLQYKKPVYTY